VNDTLSDWDFVRRVLIVLALVALAYAVWRLGDLLMLVFGAALFGLVLRSFVHPIVRATGLPEQAALAVVIFAIAGVLVAVVLPVWSTLADQLSYVAEKLPVALSQLTQRLRLSILGETFKGSAVGDLIVHVAAWGTSLATAITGILLVVVGGIYFAAAPHAYAEGLVKLAPEVWHRPLEAAADDARFALTRWLKAQGTAMVLVGGLVAVGMWLLGVPSPLALGLIAGLTEFIPIIGPILGIIPSVLLASTQSSELALWALGVAILVQQIEGNLIMPLVVGKAVELPAAVGLFAVVALGVLFGPLGLMFGYPMTVVLDAAIRRLYIREALGGPVDIPSEREHRQAASDT